MPARLRTLAASLKDWAAHEGIDMFVRAVILAEVMCLVGVITAA